jgi:dihydroorotate dehydrogenase
MSLFYDLATRAARRFDPETAHALTIKALRATTKLGVTGRSSPFPGLDQPRSDADHALLGTQLPRSALKLPNPVGLAAGFDKNAEVFKAMLGFGFGFVECGTVTPRAQSGNPRPRLFRLTEDRAVINRLGFNNQGLAAFSARLARRSPGGVVGANVGANKDSADRAGDYIIGMASVWPVCDYVTANISSPNTPGLRGLQDKAALEDLLLRLGEAASGLTGDHGTRPVFLKIAPDLDPAAIDDIVRVLDGPGNWLSGLIVSNTTLARPDGLKSRFAGEAGGLSGAPLLAPSTAVLKAFAANLEGRFDLIGVGGIASGSDAYAKIRAGAHAVQLYSALVYEGPGLVTQINSELAALLRADGFATLAEAVGADL